VSRETWAPIKGFSRYDVSTLGRVRRVATGALRKASANTNGYLFVRLPPDDGGVVKNVYVGALVLETFVGSKTEGYEVSYRNDRKDDCRLSNLMYRTHSQIMQRKFLVQGRGRVLSDDVKGRIQTLHASGASAFGIAKTLGISNSSVRMRVAPRGVAKKLSAEQVVDIRSWLKAGQPIDNIAKMFGVTRACIYMIRSGKIWAQP